MKMLPEIVKKRISKTKQQKIKQAKEDAKVVMLLLTGQPDAAVQVVKDRRNCLLKQQEQKRKAEQAAYGAKGGAK